jgi:hypothetical protein
MKIELTPRRLLELIAFAISRGNYDAALDVIDEALKQLPPNEPSPSLPAPVESASSLPQAQSAPSREEEQP